MASPYLDPGLWQYLPDEILYQVLLRLPLEAICRFRVVCSKWNYLPLSASFRSSYCHSASQGPFLVAMRCVEDLRHTPVLSLDGTKWQGLDLHFLHTALVSVNCERIIAVSSDCGFLCVSAVNHLSKIVIVVCNPLTRKYKILPDLRRGKLGSPQVVIRAEKKSRQFRVYIIGEHYRRQHCIYVYESRSDSVESLPGLVDTLPNSCGAFIGGMYYIISRSLEVLGFDVTKSSWKSRFVLNQIPGRETGITMNLAHQYKMLAHGDRLFCATAEHGALNAQTDTLGVVEFRIYELKVGTRECIRLNVGLQCLFVHVPLYSTMKSCYDWDFVVHKDYLLLVARSDADEPQNVRWLEVQIPPSESSHRFPPLSDAFRHRQTPTSPWLLNDRSGLRSLLLNSLRLDLNSVIPEVQEADINGSDVPWSGGPIVSSAVVVDP